MVLVGVVCCSLLVACCCVLSLFVVVVVWYRCLLMLWFVVLCLGLIVVDVLFVSGFLYYVVFCLFVGVAC